MATEIQASLTEFGYKTLLTSGLVDKLTYFSLNDTGNLYNVPAKNDIISEITGSHTQITDTHCGKAEYVGLFAEEPTPEEIQNVRSQVNIELYRVDCDNEFNKSNLQLKININSWLNELISPTYSFNMSESLSQTLWSYVSASVQELNLTTNNYSTTNQTTTLGLSYIPATPTDLKHYQMLSPRYVEKNGKETTVTYLNGLRYTSPFGLTFSSNNVNGSLVFGTSGILSLLPGEWGYYADGEILSISKVENSTPDTWNSISPAVKVGNNYYYLNSSNLYNTKNGLIGYLNAMVNTDGSGETALTALRNQAILFFKTAGTLNTNGNYIIPITFNVNVNSEMTDSISTVKGNRISMIFSYNESDTTSKIIEVIN